MSLCVLVSICRIGCANLRILHLTQLLGSIRSPARRPSDAGTSLWESVIVFWYFLVGQVFFLEVKHDIHCVNCTPLLCTEGAVTAVEIREVGSGVFVGRFQLGKMSKESLIH